MIRSARSLSNRVCLLALVWALAPCPSAQAQTTAFFFDSEPGDPIGQGLQRTLTLADGMFQITRDRYFTSNEVSVSVTGPGFSFFWNLDFSAAGDVPLAAGSYESARRFPFAPGNGLSVHGSTGGCNELTGRYVVREIEMAQDGSVSRFAADFEQHCDDANPGLFGAIRYNSTISDLQPFAGAYPFYELAITPPDHGRITAAGINCGAGQTTCVVIPSSPIELVLSAVPNAGYAFAGWSGDCSGAISIWLRVNQRKRCSALFEPGFQGTTALFIDSQPGDPVGQGVQRTLTPVDGTFQISRNSRNGVSLSIRKPDSMFWWFLDFSAASNAPLAVGSYGAVHDYPWTPMNGMRVSAVGGGGCGEITGRYVVREIVYQPDGSLLRFAADFEQHCGDGVPALFGAIRYRSTSSDLIPFDGLYPLYELTITPHAHGRVTGGSVDCGAGGSLCYVSLPAATHVTLTAVPDSGYVFTGWTGSCQGAATTSLHVNGPKACAALFEPLIPTSPRTVMYYDSQQGDFVGFGRKGVYSPPNSSWTVTSAGNGNLISVVIVDATDDWRIEFAAPDGQALASGYYSAARRYPFTRFNGLSISGSGSGCNNVTGRFVVLDIAIAPDGTVQRFAADFEHHCEDLIPALFVAIRYNSTISEIVPFGGAYPSFQVAVTPPVHGRITGIGIDCGGAGSQCLRTLTATTQVVLTAIPDFGYSFMGWTEDCSGGSTTSANANGPKRCAAHFEPSVPSAPRTVARWESQAGTFSGPGVSEVLSPVNSRWAPFVLLNGNGVSVMVDSVGPRSGSRTTVEFSAPTGELLQEGRRYTGVGGFPDPGVPRLFLSADGSGCSGNGGEFTVRQLSLSPQNTVLRFAADFILNCGSSSGTLTGSVKYNSTVDVPVTTLTVDPPSVRFASLHNGSIVTLQPSPQALRLTLSRPDVGWTATPSQPWIQISPASGTGSATMTVGANLLGGHPGAGSTTGNLTVTLTDGSGSSKTVNVTVTLLPTGTSTAPIGVIDTPLQNATGVTGAIPVTGWALDDLEVTGVTICRVAVSGEVAPVDANCGGAAQIFVGNAVFIEGARPDVQASYPAYPRNNAGGWGFMLLTNTLPNQGNGTFVFYAYARDREGNVVQVGTRTITCDNAHATAPFGAIDTPGQGETVSGATYVNFGWALTPVPKQIPIDGSTIMVYVDGQPIGSPSYNHYRTDVATTFPGLANSGGPVGFRVIDTTALSNGLHTIVWTATDNAGVISGLGSRYFRVSNGVAAISTTAAMTSIHSGDELARVALDTSPLAGRRSWDAEKPWQNYGVGRSGRAVLRGEEIDRFEIALGEHAGQSYAGYLRVGEGLGPLPIGSQLDPSTGAFTWSPGVGFVGTYDLVFVRSARGQPVARREVRFVLQPKGSGHIGAQVVIDTPRSQQDLAQPFVLGGWAADLDAPTGTGIDALHVWAYPLTGGAPVFLGTTTYGGARPDVAAVHGDQFRDSGFAVLVQGLTPGNYDLAVFAWSGVSGGFVPAQVVRVTAR